MRKVVNVLYGFVLFCCVSSAFAQPNVNTLAFKADYTASKTGEFLKKWASEIDAPEDTLVLLDLDDTVISTPLDRWVRPSIFYHFRDQQLEKYPHYSPKQAGDRLDHLLVPVFLRLPYELTDGVLPEAISQLQKKGIKVLGFTAREEVVIPETMKTLKGLNVAFESTLMEGEFSMENKHSLYVKEGVVFIGHGNSKGTALIALLKSGKLGKPKKVLLVDDRMEHLKTTDEAVKTWDKSLEFIAVLCTYPELFRAYEDKPTKRELLHFIYELHADPRIEALLESDPYTEEFVTEQCSSPELEDQSECKELLPKVLRKHRASVNDLAYERGIKKAS